MLSRRAAALALVALLALALGACNCVAHDAGAEEELPTTAWQPGPSPPPWPEEIESLRFGVAPYADTQVMQDTFIPRNGRWDVKSEVVLNC